VGWDVSLMLRVVGRVYGYRKKRRKGLIESVLRHVSNGESVRCWSVGGVCARSCQRHERLGIGTLRFC